MMRYVKIAMCICLLVFIVAMLRTTTSKKSAQEIADYVTSGMDTTARTQGGAKELKRYFGLNAGDYEGFVIYVPTSNMDAEELLIIKVADEGQVDAVAAAIEARRDAQIQAFSGYGEKQTAQLQDSRLITKGRLLFYAVGDDAGTLAERFSDGL